MSSLFGWDLLYNSVKSDIRKNEDVLVCLTHLVLVSNGFKCIGVGESKNIDGSETKSESLPHGWNEDYALRYLHKGRLYNLKGTIVDDGLLLNLFRVEERKLGVVTLNITSVAQRDGSLDEILPDHENLVTSIKTQLIDNVIISSKCRDGTTQTESGTSESQRSYVNEGPIHGHRRPAPGLLVGGNSNDYGRSDLDPFNGLDPLGRPTRVVPPSFGGGMLFQPPRSDMTPFGPGPDLPQGAVPPGARFDPYRPPDSRFPPRRPNRPDNDEMPPPGYDDMFM